jgi:hypothetical protein
MRRELHCSSGITAGAGAVGSVTVALPSQCPSSGGVAINVVYDMSQVSTNRWRLRRTVGTTTIVIADYITSGTPFTYTAQSASSRAILHVSFPVNVNPNEGWKSWRLVDDIVLRNTLRQ